MQCCCEHTGETYTLLVFKWAHLALLRHSLNLFSYARVAGGPQHYKPTESMHFRVMSQWAQAYLPIRRLLNGIKCFTMMLLLLLIMQWESDFYICSASDKLEVFLHISEACLEGYSSVTWAAPSHCSYTSLIICEYASSTHATCLEVPHFKEPTQHSSVQICTRGPQADSKDKTKSASLAWEVLIWQTINV